MDRCKHISGQSAISILARLSWLLGWLLLYSLCFGCHATSAQPVYAEPFSENKLSQKTSQQPRPRLSYSLLQSDCATSTSANGSEAPPPFCNAYLAAAMGQSDTTPSQSPDLTWKSIEETEHLYPNLVASYGISWVGRFDRNVETFNIPILGATAISTGPLDFTATAGIGINGLYAIAGMSVPLYYKYPNFWSLDAYIGTTFNLDFDGKNVVFWGGGVAWHLEFGVFRFSVNVGAGAVGRYCSPDVLCELGPGINTSLLVTFIKETTGLPTQR